MTYGKPNPISTAPRNGTEIFVTDGEEQCWTVVWATGPGFESRYTPEGVEEGWASSSGGEAITDRGDGETLHFHYNIVGWWPMPEPGYPE